jgi:hypothetical protein
MQEVKKMFSQDESFDLDSKYLGALPIAPAGLEGDVDELQIS